MNQPGLGLKVSELRQQKGMTQEQLSEFCQISSRTVQRIENGEVDPRTHTIKCLSTALDFDFGEQNVSNETFWLTALHLSSMICIPIIPLLLWSWKKNQSYEIDQHGRVVLNFQITMALSLFAAAFLLMLTPLILIFLFEGGVNVAQGSSMFTMLVFFVPLPLILIGIYCTYQAVVNAIRALTDKPIHYAPCIEFVK
jgi:transcriptional regulator with XRE-family HTH domain